MYTLIAYRSSGADVCMGCVVERWDSQLIFYNQLEKDKLVERWADVLILSNGNKFNEFDVAVLYNGYVLYSDCTDIDIEYIYECDDEMYCNDEIYEEQLLKFNRDRDAITECKEKAEAICIEHMRLKKAKEEEKKQLALEKSARISEQKRREQYERLKKEFE